MRKTCAVTDQPPGVNTIRRVIGCDERAQIDSRLTVRRQTHHFPFVAVGHKPEKSSELRVKETERIRPIQRQEVLEPPRASSPDRGCFPRAAAVHHYHRRVFESRVSVSTDCVRKMMIDITKSRFAGGKYSAEGHC